MTVLTFEPQFCPLVIDGSKDRTIRVPRKRPIKVRDRLSLRRWTGRPYMSKQEVLIEAVCIEVTTVYLNQDLTVIVAGETLSRCDASAFAKADGFPDGRLAMFDWFATTHGLPFMGTMIRWRRLS